MKLLYIMDPLCGWCYGNSENMLRLEQELGDRLSIDVMPGGMFIGDHIRSQDTNLTSMIRSADTRLRAVTGVAMSDAYSILLDDTSIVLDSKPPSRAINSIKKIAPEKVLKFASSLAHARYVDGMDNTKLETFLFVCEKLDIDMDLFLMYYESEDIKRNTREIFAMAAEYTHSYPSIFLISPDHSMIPIPLMNYQYINLKNEILKYL